MYKHMISLIPDEVFLKLMDTYKNELIFDFPNLLNIKKNYRKEMELKSQLPTGQGSWKDNW